MENEVQEPCQIWPWHFWSNCRLQFAIRAPIVPSDKTPKLLSAPFEVTSYHIQAVSPNFPTALSLFLLTQAPHSPPAPTAQIEGQTCPEISPSHHGPPVSHDFNKSLKSRAPRPTYSHWNEILPNHYPGTSLQFQTHSWAPNTLAWARDT